jgi:hypothetical protein
LTNRLTLEGETVTEVMVVVGGGGGAGVPWPPQPTTKVVRKRKMQEKCGRTVNPPFRRNRCDLSAMTGDDVKLRTILPLTGYYIVQQDEDSTHGARFFTFWRSKLPGNIPFVTEAYS